ncbi:LacI family transcriptional regulator [Hahella sp. HN01]|uniref:LacI family transcriptional regulator n=1 Tax=Hahella sp. HN01 TaxID=2847262 RepID=UPI001C1EFC66|nr:LacI family transcriptional regulator [Hahella sp. HN01]MBU6955488.1 LacI family transcriptional regulator [Hahella sp. HN01]
MSGGSIQITGRASTILASNGAPTLFIPIRIKRRGGRTIVTLPERESGDRPWDETLTPLQRALVRAHRLATRLESGEARNISDLAKKEGMVVSYISRFLNLTLLPPDIVAAILDDSLPSHILFSDLAIDPPLQWEEHRKRTGLASLERDENRKVSADNAVSDADLTTQQSDD